MFSTLYVDGAPVDLMDDVPETVTVEFAAAAGTYRCRACGEELAETVTGFEPDSGDPCCADDEEHDAERVPLSWCNSAAISVDESGDAVTVATSVGDPRGAFAFAIRRIPDDTAGDLAGALVMHVPYPMQPSPHMPLTPLHDGTYLVGAHQVVRRMGVAA